MAGMQDVVRVPVAEYERLKEVDRKLTLLEAHGVDNWEGYSYAVAELHEDDDE